MKMANHPRPGTLFRNHWTNLMSSLREFARAMEIAPSMASRLLTGSSFDARNGN